MIFGIPHDLIQKILRFGVVGLSGFSIDFGLTYLLKDKAHWHKYFASGLAFSIAATSNYFLNRVWTFESHNQKILEEYGKFIGVSVIGLMISLAVLWFMHGWKEKHFYLSKLTAVGIVMFWNFIANYYFTFHS